MIDLIIPFKNIDINRERNLRYVLNMYKTYVKNLNICVVEQDTNTNLSSFNIKHIKISFDNDAIHKSTCYNIGVKSTNSKYLILADSDIVVNFDFLKRIEQHFDDNKLVIPFNKPFFMLNNTESEELIQTNILKGTIERQVVNVSGIQMISRDSYYKIGGYDPQFVGWGPEDLAFFYKANKILGVIKLDGQVFHLYHEPGVKSMKYHYRRQLLRDIMDKSDENLTNTLMS